MRFFFTYLRLLVLSIFLFGCGQNHIQFRFAWLSDTHVSESSTGEVDLLAAVEDINSLKSIDFVLVTGDITDLNIDNNLQKAKDVLDKLTVPYYILPGNHDTKWTDSGNNNFIKLWGDDKFTFIHHGIQFIGMHQGPELRMADGHFSPFDLRWFDRVLSDLEDKNQPIIFITHYPVDSSIDNYDVFLDKTIGYNFRMILHGHGHKNRMGNPFGIPSIMGRSSLRAGKKTGGYTIAHVHADSIYFSERLTGIETMEPWGKLPLFEPVYSIQKDKIVRPDYTINDSFPEIRPLWTFDSHNLIVASPVYANNIVYIGDAAGNMHALAMNDGSPLWKYSTGHKIYSTAAVFEDYLIFSCTDGNIYCLNSLHGELIWSHKTNYPNVAVPIIENNVVYIGGSDSTFRAIDLKDGNLIWSFQNIKGYVESKPLILKDKIVFTAWDQTVYALDKDNGSLIWSWAEGRPHLLYSPAACWPVYANGKIFIAAPDRFLTAIDVITGKTVWRTNRFAVRETLGLSANGDLLFGQCMRDTVFAVDTKSDQFTPIWIQNFDYGYDIAPSMLQSYLETVFFATKNGLLVAFDEKKGRLKWKYKYGNTLINTVTPVNENQILFSNMDGHVVHLSKFKNEP